MRLVATAGLVVSVGLAFATAGWEPVDVVHPGGDSSRRGRLEFRHAEAGEAAPEAADADAVAGGTAEAGQGEPGEPAAAAGGTSGAAEPGTASTGQPETQPAPEAQPAPEPDLVNVNDVDLAVADHGELPLFKVANSVRVHLDAEGLLFWVSVDKRTELNSQRSLLASLGKYSDRPFLVVPDRWTAWQYVKDTLTTADAAGTKQVYLGVCDAAERSVLRLLPIVPSPPSEEARETDFVIEIEEGENGPAVVADGQEIADFPADLALAWNTWKADKGELDTASTFETPVVVHAHRFTPAGQVLQVLDVLRGLGIACERHVGATDFGGRKRR